MARLFIVMIRTDLGYRWIDSHWLDEVAAIARATQIQDSMKASGLEVSNKHYWSWVLGSRISDGKIIKPRKKKEPLA